ncbi:MAG TPA: hypothetical protein VFT72_14115 [Opitutaceae bacterium]|nr:hypothetical protein [Opitutaceae bacterium]
MNVLAQTSAPLVSEAERSVHFGAVNQHLELGGVFYGYMDVDGDVEQFGQRLSEGVGRISAFQPQLAMLKQDYAAIFGMLGLSDVKAIGLSSVAVGGGMYRNRAFLYMPNGRHGFFAATGATPHAFDEARFAPSDADAFAEGDIDLPSAYGALKQVVAKIGGDALLKPFEAFLEQKTPSGIVPLDVIQNLKGHIVGFLRVDENQILTIPGPKPMKVASFSFFVRVDGIAPAIEPGLSQVKALTKSTAGNLTLFEAPDLGVSPNLRPIFASDGKNLFLASHRNFLNECLARNDGGLAGQKDFLEAIRALGDQGNGVAYVAPHFFDSVRKILTEIGAQNPEAQPVVQGWLANLPPISAPLAAVRSNEADGILFRSNWNRSLKSDVATLAVANPITIGLLAAMAIPAFQKVRTNSQQKTVQNNLRQFEAAAQQYMLETSKPMATYEDLVGPDKYIKTLKPVAGEDYTQLVVHADDEDLSIELADGKVVHAHGK